MSTEKNKAIIRRAFEEAVNRGNMAVIDELFDWRPAEIKQSLTKLRTDFPDLRVTIEDIIAEGDKVATRETWRGNHAQTGKQVMWTVIHIFRITGGQVVEEWMEASDWPEQFE